MIPLLTLPATKTSSTDCTENPFLQRNCRLLVTRVWPFLCLLQLARCTTLQFRTLPDCLRSESSREHRLKSTGLPSFSCASELSLAFWCEDDPSAMSSTNHTALQAGHRLLRKANLCYSCWVALAHNVHYDRSRSFGNVVLRHMKTAMPSKFVVELSNFSSRIVEVIAIAVQCDSRTDIPRLMVCLLCRADRCLKLL